jgi:hypothetical protein
MRMAVRMSAPMSRSKGSGSAMSPDRSVGAVSSHDVLRRKCFGITSAVGQQGHRRERMNESVAFSAAPAPEPASTVPSSLCRAPPPAPFAADSSALVATPTHLDVNALLPARSTDGSFEFAGVTMLAHVRSSPTKFTAMQAAVGSSVDAKLLFNMLVLVQLTALAEARYSLILRNLKAWVARSYQETQDAAMPLEDVIAKVKEIQSSDH